MQEKEKTSEISSKQDIGQDSIVPHSVADSYSLPQCLNKQHSEQNMEKSYSFAQCANKTSVQVEKTTPPPQSIPCSQQKTEQSISSQSNPSQNGQADD